MTVVIDTNALLAARAPRHPFHAILNSWRFGDLVWAVSTEILLEYEEVLTARAGAFQSQVFSGLWDVMCRRNPERCRLISPTYRFHLITACPDDDKFADCAITAGADWIITSDRHFHALIGCGYKPQPITPEDFIARFLTL